MENDKSQPDFTMATASTEHDFMGIMRAAKQREIQAQLKEIVRPEGHARGIVGNLLKALRPLGGLTPQAETPAMQYSGNTVWFIRDNYTQLAPGIADSVVQRQLSEAIKAGARQEFHDRLIVRAQDIMDRVKEERRPYEDIIQAAKLEDEIRAHFEVILPEIAAKFEKDKDGRVFLKIDRLPHDRVPPEKESSAQTVRNIIESKTLSPEAMAMATELFNQSRQRMQGYDNAVKILGSTKVQRKLLTNLTPEQKPIFGFTPQTAMLAAWEQGDVLHDAPAFGSPKEAEAFATILAGALERHLVNPVGKLPLWPKEKIHEAAQHYAFRLHARDESMAPPSRAAAMLTERIRPVAEPVQEGYKLPAGTQPLLDNLYQYGSTVAHNAQNAKTLAGMVSHAQDVLDRHDGSEVAELGNMLLCPAHVVRAAKAFGVEKQLCTKSVISATPEGASARRNVLYAFPGPAREVMDALLEHDDAIILLALLTHPLERSKAYAQFLIDNRKKTAQINDVINRACANLGNYTDAELDLLSDEKEVIQLRAHEATQAKLVAARRQAHNELESEVRQAFEGVRPKKVASVNMPFVDMAVSSLEQSLPKEWKKRMDLKGMHAETPQDADSARRVLIVSNEFPAMSFKIKTDATLSSFMAKLDTLAEECEYHRTNLVLYHNLAMRGFELAGNAGASSLVHREYDIHVPLTLAATQEEQNTVLRDAESRFARRSNEQQLLLARAREAGLTVTEGSGDDRSHAITLLAPHTKKITMAPRGYMNEGERAYTEALVTREQQRLLNAPAPAAEEAAPAAPALTRWQPKNGETVIIFDTGALDKFAASRGSNDRTWMDLVKYNTGMGNVKIIPEVVMEWELQGKIPTYDAEGNRTGSVRAHSGYVKSDGKLGQIASAAEKLSMGAARAHIDADGNVMCDYPERNIVIMGTSGDREFFERVRATEHHSLTSSERRAERREKILHRDEGEKAIERILQALGGKHCIVVTNDTNWVRNDMPNLPDDALPRRCMTGKQYLESLLADRTRAEDIRTALKDPAPLTYERVASEIESYWRKFDKPENGYAEAQGRRTSNIAQPGSISPASIAQQQSANRDDPGSRTR